LESECRQKERRIRDLRKRKEYAPEIEELKNENEYLHLSILNLEDEIVKLQENEQRMRLELRETSRSSPSKSDSR
jgi:predicted  nucleic acid-binding Zn-ribbon protein